MTLSSNSARFSTRCPDQTTSQLEIVETQALKRPPEERAQLADRLIASLFEDHGVEEAWAAEVERRIKAVEGGRSELVPAAEAIARARV